MLADLKKIIGLFDSGHLRKATFLLLMVALMAFLEMVGVFSILPFMSALSNEKLIHENQFLVWVYRFFNFQSEIDFVEFLGCFVLMALIASICFKAVTNYSLLRFTQMSNYTLSVRLVDSFLSRPYEWFLDVHSSTLGKMVLSEVNQVVDGALISLMQILAHGAVVISLSLMLFLVDPVITSILLLGISAIYVLIYYMLRNYLKYIGDERTKANKKRFETIHECFGGIKEVKINGLESVMLRRFDSAAKYFDELQVDSQVISLLPRYLLEIIAFMGIFGVIYYMKSKGHSLAQSIPIVSLYALAGYRMFPCLQVIYSHASKMRFASAALNGLYVNLNSETYSDDQNTADLPAIHLKNELILDNVTYVYPGATKPSLVNVSIRVSAGSKVGIVGLTGGGKSTFADILLGLLKPTEGGLYVDGTLIDESNIRDWQNRIGYVPQNVHLVDGTIAENIALGVPEYAVDFSAMECAANVANIRDFVVNDLIDKYDTHVGERGAKLSGGQRQRIGIARALYKENEVLVLDEATSALDGKTESIVMKNIYEKSSNKTVFIITHRTSTLIGCDFVIFFENGKISKVEKQGLATSSQTN